MSGISVFHGAPTSDDGQAVPSGIAALGVDVNSGALYYRTPNDNLLPPGWQSAHAVGAVLSVFGRTGVVTAQTGDYTAAQVGAVAGSGTVNTHAIWTSTGVVGDSVLATEGLNTFLNAYTLKLSNTTLGVPHGIGFETHTQYQYGIALYGHGSTAGRGACVDFLRSRPTEGSPTAVQQFDSLGTVSWNGYDGTSYSGPGPTVASIECDATENWTTTHHGNRILFYTAPNGATVGLQRMKIDQNGTVNIFSGLVLAVNAAPTVAAGEVGFGNTVAATATAGGGQAALATVLGYLVANVAGTTVKIPYFAN